MISPYCWWEKSASGRSPKPRRSSGGGAGGGEVKRERNPQQAQNFATSTPEKSGYASDTQKSPSIGRGDKDREGNNGGGTAAAATASGSGGRDAAFGAFIENVETPEETEVARSALEQAAIVHLEVRRR